MFNQRIADEICRRISEGESLIDICKEKNSVSYSTVHYWMRTNKDFAVKYLLAKKIQADYFADEIHKIADDLPNNLLDLKRKLDENEKIRASQVMAWEALSKHLINAARIRIDVRKWSAARLRPKKYSEKYIHIHDDEIFREEEELDLTKLTDQELNELQNLQDKGRKDQRGEVEEEFTGIC